MNSEILKIFDTTLRDGEQTPGINLSIGNKLKLAKKLDHLGIDIIEAGFPANSRQEMDAVRGIALQIRRPVICVIARAIPADIEAAWDGIKDAAHPRIHVFISSSDIHLNHQLRKSKEEVVEMAVAGVRKAKEYTPDVEFSPMDATRSDPKFVYELVEAAIQAGATTVNITDTLGYAMPAEFADLISNILDDKNIRNIKKVILSVHCHDDLGNAVSNSLEAVRRGVRQVEGCINGIGERAGNAALEEIIMAIHARPDYFGVKTNINTQEIYSTSNLVKKLTGVLVQPNKAIVGRNAFRHQSGIHQDGMTKNRETYEIFNPKLVGRKSEIVIGKTSGKTGVDTKLKEIGIVFDESQFSMIYDTVKARACNGRINDEEIKEIAMKVLEQKPDLLSSKV
jgi:2-isopropylmalate synthase